MDCQDNPHNATTRQRPCVVCKDPQFRYCVEHELPLCAKHWQKHREIAHDVWQRDERINALRIDTIVLWGSV